MVDHIVLLKPHEGVGEDAIAALWTGIGALERTIPGIDSITVGPNSSPEGLERGFTLGFIVRFVDAAARDGYLPHPEHVAIVPLVHAVAREVLVFDLQLS